MTIDQRREIANSIFQESDSLLLNKGKSYAGNEDSLSNFKRNAERLGMTKYQIWAVYFFKHIDSISNALKDNPNAPVDGSEGLKGRIADAITYLIILQCLLTEDKLV
jgi:hypothetical protein